MINILFITKNILQQLIINPFQQIKADFSLGWSVQLPKVNIQFKRYNETEQQKKQSKAFNCKKIKFFKKSECRSNVKIQYQSKKFQQLIIFNIKHHSRKDKMYSRTNQPSYTKATTIQEAQPQPLRSIPFSQHSNISPPHPHHQSLYLQLPDDKISEIKQKYDKSYVPNSTKILGENNKFSATSMNFNKSTNKQQGFDENTQRTQLRQYPHNDRIIHDHERSTSGQQYLQRMSYGETSTKSEMKASLDTLNSMKNELKTKLNNLASKSMSTTNPYLKEASTRQRKQCPLDRSYDLIVSKYSKNGDYQQDNDSNYSKYQPDFQSSRKNVPYQPNQPNPYNYPFANKSTIFDKNTTYQLSSIADKPHQQYNFSKQNGRQRESQEFQIKKIYGDNVSESTFLCDKKHQVDNKYRDQRSASSYINTQKVKQRQQYRGNFQFTLRRPQQSERPTGKNNDNTVFNQAGKNHEYRAQPTFSHSNSVYLKYEPNYLKSTNNKQDLNKNSHCPSKETRSTETINRQIQKLDNKIKQIEQNKKVLNIDFNPYSPSRSANKVIVNTKQTYKQEIQISKKPPIQSKSSIPPRPSSNLSNLDRNRTNINIRHHDIAQKSPLCNQNLSFETIKNTQKHMNIPYTPAQSQNVDEQFNTERSNADQSFQKKKLKNYLNQAEASRNTGTEQRKKQQINNTVKALVKALSEQVSFDETFRNNKIWLASENNQKKWTSLKKQLQKYNVNISQAILKDTFNLDESENNPFFSVSDAKCNIRSVAQSYVQAQSHWDQKISHKFPKADLEHEGLNSNKMDYDRKGFLEIQDLVRFLNLESGTFFRLRDLSVIFKRITKSPKMQFSEFLQAVGA